MKLHRITALLVRHLYLYRRSLPRIMEIFYWPFLDLVIWGFITLYLARYQSQVPGFVTFFLGALILCQPTETERVSDRHDGYERDESDSRVDCHGGQCASFLFVQHPDRRGMAHAVRAQSGHYRLDYRRVYDLTDHEVRTRSRSTRVEHGVSLSADLLCLLSAGGIAHMVADDCMGKSCGTYL
jgi:hypothetical protein